jgi:DNA-binding winged helix-turn-helix (wHTH) protein/tetratricopeptide (TPR) repeat protein
MSNELVSIVTVVCFGMNSPPFAFKLGTACDNVPAQVFGNAIGVSCNFLQASKSLRIMVLDGIKETPEICRMENAPCYTRDTSDPRPLQKSSWFFMSTSDVQSGKELYEFGPFRVDCQKQVLLKDGEPVALTPKTFQLLLVLVRHGGTIATKDELMKAVWPDTFVEETNLTRNIFALRKALGESEQNRYIVTVPGRGYSFTEHVRLVTEPQLTIVAASQAKVQIQTVESRRWSWGIALGLIVLAAVVGEYQLLMSRRPVLTEKDSVILADFTNGTGDPVFDDTLRQGMAVELEQSPYLSLVSEDRIRHTLSLMKAPEDARLTPDLSRQICERLGSTAVIEGSIMRVGSQYVLSLHSVYCATGETLDDQQVQVGRKDDILDALNRIATKFRSRAGESHATIEQHATPLAEATTPSLEALKAYSAAWKVAFSNPQNAILMLQRAVQIDPNFSMAFAFQGRLYADILEPVLSQQSVKRAYELRNRTSDRERFFIELAYQSQVTGNLEKAQETCQVWAQTYPHDWQPHAELTWIDQELGKYDDSADEAEKAINFNPDFTPGYNNLAWAYVLSDRPAKAEDTLNRAAARKLEMPEMLVMRYYIAFLRGDKASMDRSAAAAQGHAEAEDWMAYEQASVLAYSGQMAMARNVARHAVQLARQANQPERAATYEAGMAVREAFYGEIQEARRDAQAAQALSNGRDVEWGAALAFALSGDSPESQKLADDLAKRFSEDTYVKLTYLPVLGALTALHHNDAARALDLLQTSSPIELGVPGSWSGFFGNLYPVYLRGTALLAQGHGAEAEMEFQKVLSHPGIVFTDPAGALTRLQRARAYALQGEEAKAKSSYGEYLRLWEKADPSIPVLMQARIEYAKLH